MNDDRLRLCPECGGELEWDFGDVFWEMTIRCTHWIPCHFTASVLVPTYMLNELFDDAVSAYEEEKCENE